jgi:hypothetical protein
VTVPALLSSLIDVPAGELSGVLAAGGVLRPCLGEWLGQVPDPRSPLGRWHPLGYVLGLAICAFTAAGHDCPVAVAEWAAACSQATLAALGGRRDPWSGRVRPPGTGAQRPQPRRANCPADGSIPQNSSAARPCPLLLRGTR